MALTRLRHKARVFRARGNAVECPCCGGRWKAMEAHRARANARCPGCGSLERHRTMWLFLHRETTILSSRISLLHIAPEPVFAALFRDKPNIEYLSGDLESPYAMKEMDVTALPCPDSSFDAVICNHVLEHVPDDTKALGEIYRVLKPAGSAYMQHPIDYSLEKTYEDPAVTSPDDRLREFGQEDHVRWYGADHIDRLRLAGFDVTRRRYADEVGPETAARYGLGEERGDRRAGEIHVCTRPT
jgi:SAM-dependent methyltransferase